MRRPPERSGRARRRARFAGRHDAASHTQQHLKAINKQTRKRPPDGTASSAPSQPARAGTASVLDARSGCVHLHATQRYATQRGGADGHTRWIGACGAQHQRNFRLTVCLPRSAQRRAGAGSETLRRRGRTRRERHCVPSVHPPGVQDEADRGGASHGVATRHGVSASTGTAVAPQGRQVPRLLGIWGGLVACQLGHCGALIALQCLSSDDDA